LGGKGGVRKNKKPENAMKAASMRGKKEKGTPKRRRGRKAQYGEERRTIPQEAFKHRGESYSEKEKKPADRVRDSGPNQKENTCG